MLLVPPRVPRSTVLCPIMPPLPDINNHEQIVGAAQTGMGNYHAFMFDGGRMVDLGTMGGSNSWAYGINDNGCMVGASGKPMTNMHAFLCTNALMNPVMMDSDLKIIRVFREKD